jgi:hypothetical protein
MYTLKVNKKAPITAGTVTGAEIRTAEAIQTLQIQYRPSGCASQGDCSRDVFYLHS